LDEVLSCVKGDGWIIYVGEEHEKGWIIRCLLTLINALRDRIGFIGMEHFNYTQQHLLDSWLKGSISWRVLVEEYSRGGEGFNLTLYKPLLDEARSIGVPIIGLMPPRWHASIIAHRGLEALYQEAEPLVDPGEVLREYKGYASRFLSLIPREGPMTRLDPKRLLIAQAYKDTVMAFNSFKALREYGVSYEAELDHTRIHVEGLVIQTYPEKGGYVISVSLPLPMGDEEPEQLDDYLRSYRALLLLVNSSKGVRPSYELDTSIPYNPVLHMFLFFSDPLSLISVLKRFLSQLEGFKNGA